MEEKKKRKINEKANNLFFQSKHILIIIISFLWNICFSLPLKCCNWDMWVWNENGHIPNNRGNSFFQFLNSAIFTYLVLLEYKAWPPEKWLRI